MARIMSIAVNKFRDVLSDPATGIGSFLQTFGTPDLTVSVPAIVKTCNFAVDSMQKAGLGEYPAVHVYCEKLSNTLREKFRAYSGTASLVAEIRVSRDSANGIELQSALLVDAVLDVLERSRGDWGGGVFFSGAYDVAYGPVKFGGNFFLQICRVALAVDVSAD